jgi:predicted DNA-binding transcriptional regulator AlpA
MHSALHLNSLSLPDNSPLCLIMADGPSHGDTDLSDLERDILIDEKELARRTGISASTWSKRRLTGDTPAFIKVGKSCRYRWSTVQAWLATRERKSTNDPGNATDLAA